MKALAEKIENWNKFGIIIPALLAAIGLYYNLAVIFFANSGAKAEQILPDAFYFTQLVFSPVPFEVAGYFLGYLIIPVVALIFVYAGNWLIEKSYLKENFVKKWPYVLGFSGLALLGYKIILHLFWFELWQKIPAKGDLKLQALTFVSLSLALILYWRRYDISGLLDRLRQLPWSWLRYVFFLFIIFLIFTPDFTFDHYHFNYFLGPVNDLFHGKSLLRETTTHYGLLSTAALAGIFKLVPISYQGFSLVLAISFVVWHIGWYYLIKKWLKSEVLALLSVLAMLVFLNIPQVNFDLIYNAPSNTPFHQLSVLAVAFLFYKLMSSSNEQRFRFYENLTLLVTALGFYWFVDNGIYLVLASLGTFFLYQPRLKLFFWRAVKLFFWLLLLGGAYSAGQFLTTGAWPDWRLLYEPAFFYGSGYMAIPLANHGYYYFYIFAFLLTLLYILNQGLKSASLKQYLLPLFITFFGILQLTYYITRSHPLNLSPRHSFLLILLLAWWFTVLTDKYKQQSYLYNSYSSLLAGGLLFMVIFGAFRFYETVKARDYRGIAQNYSEETIGRPEIYEGNADILDDIEVLKSEYLFIERPAIVHWYDSKILLDLNKTNYFEIFDFTAIFFKSEMDGHIQKARSQKPEYIFVGRTDSQGFGPFAVYEDKIDYFREGVGELYTIDRELKTMHVLRLK